LQFVEFLKFKQLNSEKTPNETTIKAMQAAERGEYETVSLDAMEGCVRTVLTLQCCIKITLTGSKHKFVRKNINLNPAKIANFSRK